MIATEASNLLPLFYRSLSLSSLLYPRFVLPIRGCYTLACLLHFIPPPRFPQLHYASLRIGLRCLHSSRCRAPARISGKDFPLHSCTGCNQPPLMFFFFLPFLLLRSTCLPVSWPPSFFFSLEFQASSRASTPHFTGPVLPRHSPETGPGLESVDVDALAQVRASSFVASQVLLPCRRAVFPLYWS